MAMFPPGESALGNRILDEIRRLRSSTLPFAVGTMGSKDMDRSSTFLSNPAVNKK
jgi:hypothetical protein